MGDEFPPRPWKVRVGTYSDGEEFCDGIEDANRDTVVQTDSGCYPPDLATARLIVKLVNRND